MSWREQLRRDAEDNLAIVERCGELSELVSVCGHQYVVSPVSLREGAERLRGTPKARTMEVRSEILRPVAWEPEFDARTPLNTYKQGHLLYVTSECAYVLSMCPLHLRLPSGKLLGEGVRIEDFPVTLLARSEVLCFRDARQVRRTKTRTVCAVRGFMRATEIPLGPNSLVFMCELPDLYAALCAIKNAR